MAPSPPHAAATPPTLLLCQCLPWQQVALLDLLVAENVSLSIWATGGADKVQARGNTLRQILVAVLRSPACGCQLPSQVGMKKAGSGNSIPFDVVFIL